MIRKIARFSRISLAALAITGLVVLTVVALFGEKVLKTQVRARLSEALHRRVTLGGLSVNLAGRVVGCATSSFPGLPTSKEPSLSAPRVRIALSFRSLFHEPDPAPGLRSRSPDLAAGFPDGSTDLPGMDSSGWPPSREVSIGKLVVHRGGWLNDQKMPSTWTAELRGFPSRGIAEPPQGDVAAGPGPMRF